MRLALLLALLPCVATAQNCGPDTAVIATLADKFGESVQMTGLAGNGMMLRLMGNPETGTWTVIETTPLMLTCLRASGGNMEIQPAPAAAMGEDG